MPAWTEEENFALISATCDIVLKGTWADFEEQGLLPAGRSRKACELQLYALRKKFKGESTLSSPRKSSSPTKKKAPTSPRKRKQKEVYSDQSSDEECQETKMEKLKIAEDVPKLENPFVDEDEAKPEPIRDADQPSPRKRRAAAQAAVAKYIFLSSDEDEGQEAIGEGEAIEEAAEVKVVDEIQVES